jgi:hypothetical protein
MTTEITIQLTVECPNCEHTIDMLEDLDCPKLQRMLKAWVDGRRIEYSEWHKEVCPNCSEELQIEGITT